MYIVTPKTMFDKESVNFSLQHVAVLDNTASRVFRMNINEVLTAYSLNINHWAILGLLKVHKTFNLAELSEELKLDPPFVTNLVKDLKKLGYIKIVPCSTDKRCKLIELTPKSKLIIPNIERLVERKAKKLVRATDQGIACFLRILKKVIQNGQYV